MLVLQNLHSISTNHNAQIYKVHLLVLFGGGFIPLLGLISRTGSGGEDGRDLRVSLKDIVGGDGGLDLISLEEVAGGDLCLRVSLIGSGGGEGGLGLPSLGGGGGDGGLCLRVSLNGIGGEGGLWLGELLLRVLIGGGGDGGINRRSRDNVSMGLGDLVCLGPIRRSRLDIDSDGLVELVCLESGLRGLRFRSGYSKKSGETGCCRLLLSPMGGGESQRGRGGVGPLWGGDWDLSDEYRR